MRCMSRKWDRSLPYRAGLSGGAVLVHQPGRPPPTNRPICHRIGYSGRGIDLCPSPQKAGNAEDTLVNREKEAHDRANALFKKNEDHRVKVAAQHEAEAEAVRANTARLRALRLAAEAAKAGQRETS
jgi:hypothetical protein